MGHIYCITDRSNGRRYIGQTVRTPEDRFKGHMNGKLLIDHSSVKSSGRVVRGR